MGSIDTYQPFVWGAGLVYRPPADQLLTMMYWLRNETLRVVITYEN